MTDRPPRAGLRAGWPLKYRVALLEDDADVAERERDELRSLLRWLLGILLTGAAGAITALIVVAIAAGKAGG